ncbi:MAG: hypothetical protein IPN74_16910 [Haliscomenobacter sp.]|nr:hypothetical protein [Haliscomenobacter sp.]
MGAGTTSVTLQWNRNNSETGVTYKVRLVKSGVSTPVLDYVSAGVDATSRSVPGLSAGTYTWVVRAEKSGCTGPSATNGIAESAPFSFTISQACVLNNPIATNPANNSTLGAGTTSVTLQWNRNNSETGVTYKVRLVKSGVSTPVLDYVSAGVDATSRSVPGLSAGTYTWVVRAEKSGCTGPSATNGIAESAPFSFTISQACVLNNPIATNPTNNSTLGAGTTGVTCSGTGTTPKPA